ncbi:DNA repair ATPase [Hymenobacter jeollabukensis]|uniref:AAA family ATPase n=1 Tax=Hymenobacter jeollabukensis TaxID=2025313 RepID=A0A5R8WN49_9BACT|nr:DNA repair ATPase [Hymenobacter jeollabukensis]TLM91056.1 AAA family ATPase [Hymenobacter jeollabukensis]
MEQTAAPQLETGTYEILRNRLQKGGTELRQRLERLNTERKKVFGALDWQLLGTGRITTEHNCVPMDMVALGDQFLFGYNVLLGLKTEVELSDIFGLYSYRRPEFHPLGLELLQDKTFVEELRNLYKYYKKTRFVKFAQRGEHLFMVFRVGKTPNDIKTFKWLVQGQTLTYLDNRSDHEYTFPPQHEFQWKRATRDMHRAGKHPHISIEDKVFVETVGGDLTIKVEDNTKTGQGIYAEPVENKDQTLDDAEIHYAVVGQLVLLKIRPYQEPQFRYFLYNTKLRQAQRLDALADACVLLPDGHGLIFPHGYYLQTGDGKQFEQVPPELVFERRVAAPNGEDFLYVFFQKDNGLYLLLSYNLISQRVAAPIVCHGYALFENGELCYFRADEEPKKHHAVQIWQTPYTAPDFQLPAAQDGYLGKLGNKEIVRAMAEAQEVLTLIGKDDSYTGLYLDLIRRTTSLADTYHWLTEPGAEKLAEPLQEIRQAATAAVEEFDKVQRIRRSTQETTQQVLGRAAELRDLIKRTADATEVQQYVQQLADLRTVRGEVISLKELRYVELPAVDKAAGELQALSQEVAQRTVDFLLRDDALAPYAARVTALGSGIDQLPTVTEANKLEQELNGVAAELELLIEVVGNLPIADPTQTTRIIDNISGIYAGFNQLRAALKRRRQTLAGTEAQAEFSAQLKLLEQALVNYLDLSDTPAKCDEYLSRLMVQLEELEGKFPEFDQFLSQLASRREEAYEAFEARKQSLVAARNQRASALLQSAERMLKAVHNRVTKLTSIADINGYFAADVMVEKVRRTVDELLALGDAVKADDLQSRLKTLREDAVRQLKDRADLFVDGGQAVRFGPHTFTVNTQPLELTLVLRDGTLHYHLTGTNFFRPVESEAVQQARPVWEQTLPSENQDVYRAEFLADYLLRAAQHPRPAQDGAPAVLTVPELERLGPAELLAYVQQHMAPRYAEGYLKGVHDHDAAQILAALVRLTRTAGLLRYPADTRAAAGLYWHRFAPAEQKAHWQRQIQGLALLLQVFPDAQETSQLTAELQAAIEAFAAKTGLFAPAEVAEAGEYLLQELIQQSSAPSLAVPQPTSGAGPNGLVEGRGSLPVEQLQTPASPFTTSAEAADLYDAFQKQLKERRASETFGSSVAALSGQPTAQFQLIRQWLQAFQQQASTAATEYRDEAAVLLATGGYAPEKVVRTPLTEVLPDMRGNHPRIVTSNEQQTTKNEYHLDFPAFRRRLHHYRTHTLPQFEAYQALKKELLAQAAADMRLEDFRPRVLTSFVRNQLIDQVYLPLIGANLAKQIGTAGEGKRTDLMGLLLLISPPGYGKTTLLEYVANRLGLIFMKINGPAIGHAVTSVDPAQAPNAGARQELEKLNLAFEMGDNVMIYVDDIQHCHPEFLQKFISLCDAQRKIEGVYQGRSRTYDFRGRKVCVVMAGNPYTESGEVFRIPDMLANRADIYNLGDILTAGSEQAFRLSYLENALTSHPTLARLAAQAPQDVPTLLRLAETGQADGLTFEGNHSPEELSEYVSVLRQLLRLRDVVARVNAAYISSAAQADAYRTEPPFKLQGSYRNMNKLAEKVRPVMNDQEIEQLLAAHYESEAQTLTSATEANLLKLRELLGWLTPEQEQRWQQIKQTYLENLRNSGAGQLLQMLDKLESIAGGLSGIREVLKGAD